MEIIRTLKRKLFFVCIFMIIYGSQTLFFIDKSFNNILEKVYKTPLYNILLLLISLILTNIFMEKIKSEHFVLRFNKKSEYNEYSLKYVILINTILFFISIISSIVLLIIINSSSITLKCILKLILHNLKIIVLSVITSITVYNLQKLNQQLLFFIIVMLVILSQIPLNTKITLNILNIYFNKPFINQMYEFFNVNLLLIVYGGLNIIFLKRYRNA